MSQHRANEPVSFKELRAMNSYCSIMYHLHHLLWRFWTVSLQTFNLQLWQKHLIFACLNVQFKFTSLEISQSGTGLGPLSADDIKLVPFFSFPAVDNCTRAPVEPAVEVCPDLNLQTE